MHKNILAYFLSFAFAPLLAQQPEMADTMRSEGKIYVVVAILLIILIGLIGYLILIDKKVTRLENKITDKK